jgi:hypothetical protein
MHTKPPKPSTLEPTTDDCTGSSNGEFQIPVGAGPGSIGRKPEDTSGPHELFRLLVSWSTWRRWLIERYRSGGRVADHDSHSACSRAPPARLVRLVNLNYDDLSGSGGATCDHPPHHQDYDRANGCTNETGALAGLIPPDSLAKEGGNQGSHNSKHGRQNES